MKPATFAGKLRTVTGLLHSWPSKSKQKKIGDFKKGKAHVCSLNDSKVIIGQSSWSKKKVVTWTQIRPETGHLLCKWLSSGDPGSIPRVHKV